MGQPEPAKVLRLRSVVRGNRTQKPGYVCRRRLLLGEITSVDAAGIRGYMWAVLLLLCFASSRALDPSRRVARPHTVCIQLLYGLMTRSNMAPVEQGTRHAPRRASAQSHPPSGRL